MGREKGSEGTLFYFSDYKGNGGRVVLSGLQDSVHVTLQ